VSARIETALKRFDRDLPKRIKLERGFEQSRNVSSRLDHLYRDFTIAIGLVLLTLLPLGWRAASIVMVSIPLSLTVGLTSLYFLDYSLNQISIAAFVVTLGLLVDDSIVVTETLRGICAQAVLAPQPPCPEPSRFSLPSWAVRQR